MSRNSKTSAAQQLKFVMECRKSGKTDAQWCIESKYVIICTLII